jgi:ketosteroid isomerase-like protein
MGRAEVEFVSRVQDLVSDDLVPLIDDESFLATLQEVIAPRAEVRFVDPQGGALGDRRFPDGGVEGLREGWRDWLQPWEHFWIRFGELLDAGEGRVLSFGELRGRMRVGVEVTQPGAAIIEVRDERVVAMAFYVDQDQARRDAGLD